MPDPDRELAWRHIDLSPRARGRLLLLPPEPRRRVPVVGILILAYAGVHLVLDVATLLVAAVRWIGVSP